MGKEEGGDGECVDGEERERERRDHLHTYWC